MPLTPLAFSVTGARTEAHAAVPTVVLRLGIDAGGAQVHAMALRCQIRIEPQQRRYQAEEADRLYELFGDTPQWGDSLRPFLWTHVSTTVGSFRASTEVDLPVECSYDFEVAGAKYFHGLTDGEIPLLLLFSGTAFVAGETGFSAEPISWGAETRYRLPVATWRSTMDVYFPNSGWIRLPRETLDRLGRYKATRALATWDQAVGALLATAEEEVAQ